MTTIAFDTASDTFSLGLAVHNQRYYLEIAGSKQHSEVIMEAADTLLRLGCVSKSNLEAVACMEGPGSFTGLRIGFAAAKGLAFALGIPLIPVPTLDCMASPFSFWPGIVLPLIDAKKNAFFTALYRHGKPITPYLDTDIDNLIKTITGHIQDSPGTKLLLSGPSASMALNRLESAFPGAVFINTIERGYAGELLNLAKKESIIDKGNLSLGPLYLRKSDAELYGERIN